MKDHQEVSTHKMKYTWTMSRMSHKPPMMPTWAQTSGGQIFSACVVNVSLDADANWLAAVELAEGE